VSFGDTGGTPAGSDTRRVVRAVSHILRAARKRRGLSQERLASLAGFTRTTVLDVEHKRRDMSYLNVRHWLSACDMTWKDFGTELQEHDPLSSPAVIDDRAVGLVLYAGKLQPLEALAGKLQPLEALGAVVHACQRAAGKTMEGFANDSGLDRGQLLAMQRGERNPRLRTLRRVLQGMGTNWQDFFSLVHRLDAIQGLTR
jgi:transcriptional regulator with XRE-family HTH domain